MKLDSADGKVLERAKSLHTVQGALGNVALAEEVMLPARRGKLVWSRHGIA
jgi:hypothetical protein